MAIRTKPLRVRVLLLLLGLLLVVGAAATLREGEPDYRNHFNQPVSAHVVLLIGAALTVAALVPWKGAGRGVWRSRAQRRASTRAVPAPRNAPCPCGSGRKFKRCCLAADEERGRAEALRKRSVALNRANGVTSATGMVNRGLKWR